MTSILHPTAANDWVIKFKLPCPQPSQWNRVRHGKLWYRKAKNIEGKYAIKLVRFYKATASLYSHKGHTAELIWTYWKLSEFVVIFDNLCVNS